MGKKDKDKKKKGKGAEKTAAKTEKKLNAKLKKELKAKGEDDIESMIKAIEAEEKKRSQVKELKMTEPPSHRSNFTLCAHPDNPELWMFGGEFYNGKQNLLNNDLCVYNTKRKEWTQIKSPNGPPPRSSHQAVLLSANGGQLWIFGGEYVSPSETQFYHYKDLWVFHIASKRWEKINAPGGPSSRSGHRMVHVKKHLIVFGGFHDNLRDCKYFNDAHAFDLEERKWKKMEFIGGTTPTPRSGCVMFPLIDPYTHPRGGAVVFGGYVKEKSKKQNEKGTTLVDMYTLIPDKHDETLSKWRWQTVKQVGHRPTVRSGMSCAVLPGTGKVFIFGGVQDNDENNESDDSDSESGSGSFFNELYSVHVENERANWSLVNLTGPKSNEKTSRRRKKEDEEDEDLEKEDLSENVDGMLSIKEEKEKTVTVEEGAFTITSTVGSSKESDKKAESTDNQEEPSSNIDINLPSPRFGSALTAKNGMLYLFGGLFEDSEDRQITLKDFYSLDIHKLEQWETIIESDVNTMEWFESDDSESEDDDEEEDSEMDTD